MKRHHIYSSAIRSVGYDPLRHQLEIRYIDGDLYRYFKVPKQIAEKLEEADSKGQFVNEIIKPFFRVEKVEEKES